MHSCIARIFLISIISSRIAPTGKHLRVDLSIPKNERETRGKISIIGTVSY